MDTNPCMCIEKAPGPYARGVGGRGGECAAPYFMVMKHTSAGADYGTYTSVSIYQSIYVSKCSLYVLQ